MTARILALLEEHDNSLQVKACLESSGHEVFVVEDFTTAEELFILHKFDLIISDVHLQNGGDVFDFLRWVKKHEHTRVIPFVLFSSEPTPMAKYLADGVRISARVLGAAKYIEMAAFNAADFKDQINSVLPEDKKVSKISI